MKLCPYLPENIRKYIKEKNIKEALLKDYIVELLQIVTKNSDYPLHQLEKYYRISDLLNKSVAYIIEKERQQQDQPPE